MKKVGRNDLCPCGSGRKYKRCCISNDIQHEHNWNMNVKELIKDNPQNQEISTIYLGILDIIEKLNWEGACHATSSIMYILFKEIGLNPKLCIGEVCYNNLYFDHSWIELDNNIYDVSVYKELNGVKISEPIINGYNVKTKEKCKLVYGGNRIYNIDDYANRAMKISFIDYLNSFKLEYIATERQIQSIDDDIYDFSKEGLWGFVSSIGNRIGLDCDIELLKEKYKNTKRIEK